MLDLLGSSRSSPGLAGIADGSWWQCDVIGEAIPKGRPRGRIRGKTVQMYTPERTEIGEAFARLCWITQVGVTLLAGPLQVRIITRKRIPKSWPDYLKRAAERGRKRPTGKPDADNLAKLVLDALNGVAWLDDGQVVDLTISKRYCKPGEPEGVALWVRCWRAKYGEAPF